MTEQQRFIVLGTGGSYTYNVIQTLVDKNYQPLAYIQSGSDPNYNEESFANVPLEVIKPASALTQLLASVKTPVHYQSEINLAEHIQQLRVEYLVVACWPELIPNEVLQSVSKAALNLHPSLLPKYRGVDPIGEQLFKNDDQYGVSLHLLSEQLDAGDIVFQEPLEQENSRDKSMIEKEAARKGAELFIRAVNTHQDPGWELIKQAT